MRTLTVDQGAMSAAYLVVAWNIAETLIHGPVEIEAARDACRSLLDEDEGWDFASILGPLPVVETYESDPAPSA